MTIHIPTILEHSKFEILSMATEHILGDWEQFHSKNEKLIVLHTEEKTAMENLTKVLISKV